MSAKLKQFDKFSHYLLNVEVGTRKSFCIHLSSRLEIFKVCLTILGHYALKC